MKQTNSIIWNKSGPGLMCMCVTSFLSISCLSNSEYASQKIRQSGNIYSINKMSVL